ncbi:hypothetical protein [Streptomyces sp. AS02]|uniref:hypothetical protein n=1 Tax=Streptomyces sp. AS02 TaxID=2938946 RepID=UPI002020B31A|nr:hypothetical protein [Streptomyces sp. AS02]MCL8009764.1 hypothetical protein [Streptomyces sp. AS02]
MEPWSVRPIHPPTIETGAASIDGRQHVPTFADIRDDATDTDDATDCPWCAALHEASLPSPGLPSMPSGRRHDPYVSGAQYDDW